MRSYFSPSSSCLIALLSSNDWFLITKSGNGPNTERKIFLMVQGFLGLVKTLTFLQYFRSSGINFLSLSSLIKEKSVISCFLARYFMILYHLVCPPLIVIVGRYG